MTYRDIDENIASTPFKYPEGEFFEDEEENARRRNKEKIFNSFLCAMGNLEENERIIVILRLLNPTMSLRSMALIIKMSHEYVRKKLNKVEELYPTLHEKIKKN